MVSAEVLTSRMWWPNLIVSSPIVFLVWHFDNTSVVVNGEEVRDMGGRHITSTWWRQSACCIRHCLGCPWLQQWVREVELCHHSCRGINRQSGSPTKHGREWRLVIFRSITNVPKGSVAWLQGLAVLDSLHQRHQGSVRSAITVYWNCCWSTRHGQ